ncbi:hypothetical protein PRZ48_010255 [Zasmidium cellare]|uniref:Uncharacterized protein n=1 Tax=Zasmidium cellare TaxID=395010 RepID=A0ABR0E841_ZASCE|nr:hypothetical protein PRZ48_010255 [Zasmidium cellare]
MTIRRLRELCATVLFNNTEFTFDLTTLANRNHMTPVATAANNLHNTFGAFLPSLRAVILYRTTHWVNQYGNVSQRDAPIDNLVKQFILPQLPNSCRVVKTRQVQTTTLSWNSSYENARLAYLLKKQRIGDVIAGRGPQLLLRRRRN